MVTKKDTMFSVSIQSLGGLKLVYVCALRRKLTYKYKMGPFLNISKWGNQSLE
jgi:hypothetical protein